MTVNQFFYGASCVLLAVIIVMILAAPRLGRAEPSSTPHVIGFVPTESSREPEATATPTPSPVPPSHTIGIIPTDEPPTLEPTATIVPTATAIPTATSTSTATAPATATQVPIEPSSTEPPTTIPGTGPSVETDWSYFDIGGAADTWMVGEGFGPVAQAESERWTCALPQEAGLADIADGSWRTMQQSGNSVVYLPVTPGEDLELSFCVSHGGPDDYWDLWLGGPPPVECQGTVWASQPAPIRRGAQIVGPVRIPGGCLDTERVVLAFTTKGSDEIALWGVLLRQVDPEP